MKYLIIALALTVSACASTPGTTTNNQAGQEIVAQNANKELSGNLFAEAHRCQGTVKYQAEMQDNSMRSRLTCAWEVNPDEWGSWE